jgi:hypothetical protein
MISLTARGIVTLVNLRLSNCIFYFCVKTQPTVVVDRIKAETLDMDYFCLGCHLEIMGPYVYGTSALLWKFMQSQMQSDSSLFSFSQLIMSAE